MSLEYRSKRHRRDILEELRQQDKFSDVVLVAWAIIELNLDQATLAAYRLSTHNPRSEIPLAASVDQKLRLFKDLSYLDEDENRLVKEFQQERNKLFHKSKGLFIPNLPQAEKERLMDTAMKAVDVSHLVADRARDESTTA